MTQHWKATRALPAQPRPATPARLPAAVIVRRFREPELRVTLNQYILLRAG